MAKQFFKDLPDTTTPLTASRINGLLDGEEAIGNIVVDDVNCKNVFDYTKNNSLSASYTIDGNKITLASSGSIYIEVEVQTGKTYTFSYETNNGFSSIRISDYNNGSWIEYGRTSAGSNGTITFTATSNLAIVQLLGGTANSSYITKGQIELGSTATSYFQHKKVIKEEEGYVKENTTFYANDFKSRNLANLQFLQLMINSSGTVISNGSAYNVIIDTTNISSIYVSGNFSLLGDSTLRIGKYSSYPVLGSSGTRTNLTTNGSIDVSSTNYLLLAFIPADGVTNWLSQVRNSFMVEVGTEPTSFTPYKNFDATDILKYQNGEIMFNFTSNLTTSYDNQSDKTLKWMGFNNQTANSPDNTASGIVISFRDETNWGWQTAFYNGKIRIRQKQNGTWGSWISPS